MLTQNQKSPPLSLSNTLEPVRYFSLKEDNEWSLQRIHKLIYINGVVVSLHTTRMQGSPQHSENIYARGADVPCLATTEPPLKRRLSLIGNCEGRDHIPLLQLSFLGNNNPFSTTSHYYAYSLGNAMHSNDWMKLLQY